MKGVVTLGSLRVRQDFLIAEGLLSPYEGGDEMPSALSEMALARIRQLSAHEVGHTLGLGHNFYASTMGRISVLDYPHPLITIDDDGDLDLSDAYDVGIGEWDKVAIRYGYQDFPQGTDEPTVLEQILDQAWERDLLYLTNQDLNSSECSVFDARRWTTLVKQQSAETCHSRLWKRHLCRSISTTVSRSTRQPPQLAACTTSMQCEATVESRSRPCQPLSNVPRVTHS